MSSVTDALDADVFIHTWDTVDHHDPTWWRSVEETERTAARTDPELVSMLLRPVSMIIEPSRTFSTRSVRGHGQSSETLLVPVSSVMSLWFGVSESFRLMQEHEIVRGARYEHVVRWRFDLLPSRPLGPADCDGRLRLASWSNSRPIGISSDVAAVGPRHLMESYASVYATLPASIDAFMADSGYNGFCHEALLEACLRSSGIEWVDLELGTTLIRPDGSQQVISSPRTEMNFNDFELDRFDHFLAPSQGDRIAEILRSRLESEGCSDAVAVTAALLSSKTSMTRAEALQSFRVLRSFVSWLCESGPNGQMLAQNLLGRWWTRYRRFNQRAPRLFSACSPEFWSLWSFGAKDRIRLRLRTRLGSAKRSLGALRMSIRADRSATDSSVTLSHSLPSRGFNEVIVHPDRAVVHKSSQHAQTLLDEIGYLNALPTDLRPLFAPVRAFSTEPAAPFLELDFIEGRPLDQLFLDDQGSVEEWSSIWGSVADTVEILASHRGDVSVESVLEMYVGKTRERLEMCQEFADPRRVLERETLLINGVEHRGLESLVRSAQERVIATTAGAYGSVIHGDLCLSNILRTGESVVLIDPRGRFGTVGVHGDLRYDIAKLHHSVVGGYDHMVAGQFSFDIGSTGIEFSLEFSPRQLAIADLYRDRILRDWSSDEIELISGLILAGLAPLHSDAPNRQVAFLLRATQVLSSVLDGPSVS
jgi:hypothetical protein